MAFPIMVMYVLYFDTLFMGIISGVFLVLNIVSVVMAAISGSMPSGIDFALSSALLQAATMVSPDLHLHGLHISRRP